MTKKKIKKISLEPFKNATDFIIEELYIPNLFKEYQEAENKKKKGILSSVIKSIESNKSKK